MHEDDARLEMQIALCTAKIRQTSWSRLVNDPHAGENSTDVLTPLAYAMFDYLSHDVASDPESWAEFLRHALNEVIWRRLGQ